MQRTARRQFTKRERDKQRARFGGRCGYCGTPHPRLQIDHIKPLVSGGAHDESNWMPACPQCNNYKLFYTLEQFRKMLESQRDLAFRNSLNYRFALKFGLIQETLKDRVIFYFEEASES